MANVVVTSTATKIIADFGALSSVMGLSKGTWNKDDVTSIVLGHGSYWVEIHTKDGHDWKVSYTATTDALVVDSVDGVAPSDNADLYTKLVALMV